MSLAVIAMGLHLVSFRSQKLSLFAFCLCTMGFGLWEFHLAASLFFIDEHLVLLYTNFLTFFYLLLFNFRTFNCFFIYCCLILELLIAFLFSIVYYLGTFNCFFIFYCLYFEFLMLFL